MKWWVTLLTLVATSTVFAMEMDVVDDWIELKEANAFTFRAPSGTTKMPVQGYDSLVGAYVNPPFRVGVPYGTNFSIGFDYGVWSNNLSDHRNDPRFSKENVGVDGRTAIIVTGPGSGEWGCSDHLTAMYVVILQYQRQQPVALEMHGCTKDVSQIPTIHQIFKSVRFTRFPSAF